MTRGRLGVPVLPNFECGDCEFASKCVGKQVADLPAGVTRFKDGGDIFEVQDAINTCKPNDPNFIEPARRDKLAMRAGLPTRIGNEATGAAMRLLAQNPQELSRQGSVSAIN